MGGLALFFIGKDAANDIDKSDSGVNYNSNGNNNNNSETVIILNIIVVQLEPAV